MTMAAPTDHHPQSRSVSPSRDAIRRLPPGSGDDQHVDGQREPLPARGFRLPDELQSPADDVPAVGEEDDEDEYQRNAGSVGTASRNRRAGR
jgi:hypothetical protein